MAKSPKTPVRPDLPAEVLDVLVLGKVVELLTSGQPCTAEKVARELAQAKIKKTRVTRLFHRWQTHQQTPSAHPAPLDSALVSLGARVTGHEIKLDGAARWFKESRMYLRMLQPMGGKEVIGQAVGDEIENLIKTRVLTGSPWIFADAGTQTLACLRYLGKSIRNWNVLTNNIWIVLDLLASQHEHCYVPPGKPHLNTAAIVQTPPSDLLHWLQANPPQVALVSFHYLQVQSDKKEFIFAVDVDEEQATKIAGMQHATEAVFILVDKSKIRKDGYGTPTVRVKDGKWYYYTSSMPTGSKIPGSVEQRIRAKRLFLCTDAPDTEWRDLEVLEGSKLSYTGGSEAGTVEVHVKRCWTQL